MRLPATATRTNWRMVTLAGAGSDGAASGTLPGLSSKGGDGAATMAGAPSGTSRLAGAGGIAPGGGGVGTNPQAPSQISSGLFLRGAD